MGILDVPGISPAGLDAAVTALQQDPTSEFFAAGNATYATTAAQAQRLLAKLDRDVENSVMLYVGDSTGNETTEHVYLEFQALAARFPKVTFIYYLVNPTTGVYDSAPVTVQTGTGTTTCTLYNCSISGSAPGYILGSRWNDAIVAVPEPDLMFVSHSHNMGDPSTANGVTTVRGQYLALTEELTQQFPKAGLILESQNPTTTPGRETWQAIKAGIIQQIAAQRGYGFIDVHKAITDYATKNSVSVDSLLLDQIHPAPAASQVWADTVGRALTYAPGNPTLPQQGSSLNNAAESLVPDPQFKDWSGSLPAGWTVTNATAAKDTTNFETGSYGLQITSGGTSGTAMAEFVYSPATLGVKGKVADKVVTFAVRMFIPAANTGTPGVLIKDQTGSANQRRVDAVSTQRDRFAWIIVSKRIASPATTVTLQIASRWSGAATGSVTVDRIIHTVGDLPREALIGTPGPAGAAGSNPGQMDFLSTFGDNPAVAILGTNSGVGVGTANQAVLHPIKPHRNMTISTLRWLTHTASGNYDIGIYDAAGNKLWSKGSTAMASGANTETVSPTVALTAGTLYYIAVAFDTTTGFMRGFTVTDGTVARFLDGTASSKTASAAFPLPATVTFGATPSNRFHLVQLGEA